MVSSMQVCRPALSSSKKLSQFAFGITTVMLLSACGAEGLEGVGTATNGQPDNTIVPTVSAATPDNNSSESNAFTAQRLDDGSMLLDWPGDPAAVKYLVVIDGDVVAELPASTTSFVAVADTGTLENSNIQILAQDASDTLTPWVNNPTIVQTSEQPQTEQTGTIVTTASTDSPAQEPDTGGSTQPTSPISIIESSTDNARIINPAPSTPEPTDVAEAVAEVETQSPVEQLTTDIPPAAALPEVSGPQTEAENPAPVEVIDETPTGEEEPAEEEPTTEQLLTEEEPVNVAPDITNTSYNCDPLIESVAFSVGDSDFFTLQISDESLLTLSYAADSSKEDIVSVTVDENGIFTVTALQAGDSYLWLTAEDDNGLQDEFELHVIVQD